MDRMRHKHQPNLLQRTHKGTVQSRHTVVQQRLQVPKEGLDCIQVHTLLQLLEEPKVLARLLPQQILQHKEQVLHTPLEIPLKHKEKQRRLLERLLQHKQEPQ
jgi:hypothetical protein